MDYSYCELGIPAGADCCYVLGQIAKLDGVIVVNLALAPEGSQLLFTQDNLQTILESNPPTLYLVTVPELQYIAQIKQQLASFLKELAAIRAKLCHYQAREIGGEIADLLTQMQNIALLVECFALKKNRLTMSDNLKKLAEAQERLGVACFYLEDNVLCSDILHYSAADLANKLLDELQ